MCGPLCFWSRAFRAARHFDQQLESADRENNAVKAAKFPARSPQQWRTVSGDKRQGSKFRAIFAFGTFIGIDPNGFAPPQSGDESKNGAAVQKECNTALAVVESQNDDEMNKHKMLKIKTAKTKPTDKRGKDDHRPAQQQSEAQSQPAVRVFFVKTRLAC